MSYLCVLARQNSRRLADRIACLEVPYPRELRAYEDFFISYVALRYSRFACCFADNGNPPSCAPSRLSYYSFGLQIVSTSRAIPEIPVALLRFVTEIAEIRSQERLQTEVNLRTQALLTLPFRNRGCGRDTAARPCERRFCETRKHRKFPRLVYTNR